MTKSVFTSEYRAFLQVLIQLRMEQGKTQFDLAQKLKKPQSFVSKYESGERRLDVIETLNITDALGISSSVFWKKLEKILNEIKYLKH